MYTCRLNLSHKGPGMATSYWTYRHIYAINWKNHVLNAWYHVRRRLPLILPIFAIMMMRLGPLAVVIYFALWGIILAIAGGPIIVSSTTAAVFIDIAIMLLVLAITTAINFKCVPMIMTWVDNWSKKSGPLGMTNLNS